MVDENKVRTLLGKRKRSCRRLDASYARAILALRKYFELERSKGSALFLRDVVKRTSLALQIGVNSVCKVRSEEDLENFPAVGEKEARDRCMEVPAEMAGLVRRVVSQMVAQEKAMPSLEGVFSRLKEMPCTRNGGWKWGQTTLYRFMLRIGFSFGTGKSHYDHVKESLEIQEQRASYIEWVRKYRREGYKLFYQDETWVFKNMAQAKV